MQDSVYKRIYGVNQLNKVVADPLPVFDKIEGIITREELLVALVDYELETAPWIFRSYKVEWDNTLSFEGRVATAREWTCGDNEGTPWGKMVDLYQAREEEEDLKWRMR